MNPVQMLSKEAKYWVALTKLAGATAYFIVDYYLDALSYQEMKTYGYRVISMLTITSQFIVSVQILFLDKLQINQKYYIISFREAEEKVNSVTEIEILRLKAITVLEEITNGHGFRWIEWNEEYEDWRVNEDAQKQVIFTNLFVTLFENGPSILLKTGNLINNGLKISSFWAFSVLFSVGSFVSKVFGSYEKGFNGRYNSCKALTGLVSLFVLIALFFYIPLIENGAAFRLINPNSSYDQIWD